MNSQSKAAEPWDGRVIAGAVLAGVPRGHIEREARAMAACFGGWDHLSQHERQAYRAEAAGISVGVHVA